MSLSRRYCLSIVVLVFALAGASGCAPKTVSEPPVDSAPTKATLEIDAMLTGSGLQVTEKSRDARRLMLQFRAIGQDHESRNYTYILYDATGAKLDTTGFSIPGFKKEESYEYELANDDLAKAHRVVIRPFGQ